MLTGIHIAFIGGDARQLEVIRICLEMDATVTLIGFDRLEAEFPGAEKAGLRTQVLESLDALVLPIVGTDDTGRVINLYSEEDIFLRDEHLCALPKNCTVYTGMAKSYLKDLCRKHSVHLEEFLKRDEVAIYNSIPTAEGAIMMAIQNTDFTLHGSRTAVLGYGRTGVTLARMLHALGSHVRVGVHRPDHLARAYEQGLDPFFTENLQEAAMYFDIVFNTVPELILTAPVIANLPLHAFIVDLASAPGGTDFRFAEKRGIRAVLAPSLPGIVAPKTAGQIIANTLIKLVQE